MKDIIGALLVLIVGGIFLWVGLFRIDEVLKAIKEGKKARIDPFRFISRENTEDTGWSSLEGRRFKSCLRNQLT